MRYDTRYRSRSSLFNWSLPAGVKWLIISNVALFVGFFFISRIVHEPGNSVYTRLLIDLVPAVVIRGAVWQLVTYLFLHDLTSFWHILFNMLTLWMFGAPIEETWGTKRFLRYYFLCGTGAGVCVVLANLAFGDPYQRTIGASGAIYGLLLAFGMLFPNQTVLMSFLFPIKAKYMVMIFGAIAFMSSFQAGSTVSNLAHLGGMLFGFVYMKTQFGARIAGGNFDFDFRRQWKDYKLLRARKKFKVYLKKHGSDRDPWVN
jgi:membrane associated rhomboid family serine protease